MRTAVIDLMQSVQGRDATWGFEGLVLHAYYDGAGVGSIGRGHTGGVHQNEVITVTQANELYYADINVAHTRLVALVTVPLAQTEYDALLDFVFNVGPVTAARATLIKQINAGDYYGGGQAFLGWVYDIKHKVEPGLMRRAKWRMQQFPQAHDNLPVAQPATA